MKIDPKIFKAYDVRGIYPDEITTETAYAIGRAFGMFVVKDLKASLPCRVAVGLDMRGSSPFLAQELIRGITDEQVDVVDIGRVPTPAFYYAVAFKDLAAGVMVTASHNPKEYNGFKFCGPKASPIGENTGLPKIAAYAANDFVKSKLGARGKTSTLENMTAEYVNQDLSYLNFGKIKKLKIAADPANAMGSLYLDELFKHIACDAIRVNWELNGNMPVHEANPLKVETLQQLQEVVRNGNADFGIATDGDGDRLAFLDERGDVIPPSVVTGLVAQALLKKYPGSKVGYDLRSSRVVKEMIESAGGTAVETRVGHAFIKSQMKQEDIIFAGELSSHYYFRENYYYEAPVFVAAQLLLLRSEADKPFSDIWRSHLKYSHSGEINFEVEDKKSALERLEKKYADGKISKLDGLKVDYEDWWFNVRPSNTEPLLRLNLEASDETAMKQKVEEVSAVIRG